MEACVAVDREVEKVLTKFGGINEHASRVLKDVTKHIESIKNELDESKFYYFYLGEIAFWSLFMFD